MLSIIYNIGSFSNYWCMLHHSNKRLLFLLMESLETEDQLKLSVSLSSYVPALEAPVKTLETLFLHLMSSRSTGEVCSILMRGLNTMARPDLVSQFRGMACDSSDCEVHLTRPSLPYYQLGPGLCVIINQKLFSCPDLQDRLGSDKDVESLKNTFTMLGVAEQDFLLLQNVTDTEMMSGLERAAEMSGRAHLAWVAVVVLSHGKRVQGWDLVMGVNGKGVDRTDIQEKFSDSSCPNLTGKPKLFFYQACRDEGEESEKIDQKSRPVRQAVGSSDVFSYSSTTPGFLSYRHTQDGSFFIQCLCHVLQDNAQLEDLDNLVKRVNRQLRELEPPSQPEYSSTMSRQFKFQVTMENKIRAAQQIRVSVFDRNLNDFVQNYNQTTM